MSDLDAFAETLVRKTGKPCSICVLPQREWVEAARARGLSVRVIAETLTAKCGYALGRSPLERHLRDHVRRG